jgi:hypothetical protein
MPTVETIRGTHSDAKPVVKHLYEVPAVNEVKQRIARLRPDTPGRWGRMSAAQMLAHCSASFEMAMGLDNPPRMMLGRIFGRIARQSLLYDGKPMKRNSPTTAKLRIRDDRHFPDERDRLLFLVDRFANGGPDVCTRHPHTFFGPLTPVEWATLMYTHLDHHLRQFDA